MTFIGSLVKIDKKRMQKHAFSGSAVADSLKLLSRNVRSHIPDLVQVLD